MSARTPAQIIQEVLKGRGIPVAEQERFRSPDFTRDTHSPWLLKGMEEAVTRLSRARHEHIVIFGDYDADGVPGTALLQRALRDLGYERVTGLIPTREQGYGLTPETVAAVLTHRPDLVITVDNGIVSHHEVATLAEAGSDVIIVDHHEPLPGKVARAAVAIINPKQEGCTYPFRELCACTLAWKLAAALAERLGGPLGWLKWELDLVALSTIADMVPLTGENRVLARFGLTVLRKSRNVGLQALAAVAGLRLSECDAGDVGFKLAPRINAPSRMHGELVDNAHLALTLLTTDDTAQAERLAAEANRHNVARQQLVEKHLEEAERQLAERAHPGVLVVYHDSWSTGVIGLVASRLSEKYGRPAVVLAPEQGVVKGSVRSTGQVHALELLETAAAELERFGGHAKAAGLTVKGSVAEVQRLLEQYMDSLSGSLTDVLQDNDRPADGKLELGEVTVPLAEALAELEPFGLGFPTPLFTVEGEARTVRAVGAGGAHLSFFLTDGNERRKAIAFRYDGPPLQEGVRCRVRCSVQAETWREVTSAQCVVHHLELID